MKMKCIVLFIIGFCFADLSMAQFKYYKVENGVETLLGENENFVIALNEKMRGTDNFVIEIDLEKVKANYKFDQISVGFATVYVEGKESTYLNSPRRLSFDDPVTQKMLGDAKIFRFWLFKTESVTENSVNAVLMSDPLLDWQAEEKYNVLITGSYFKEHEKYYDERTKTVKQRALYTKGEKLTKSTSTVSFTYPDIIRVEKKYGQMVTSGATELEAGYNLEYMTKALKQDADAINKMEADLMYTQVSLYPNISAALLEIADYKKKEILAETDKQKAIDMVIAYNEIFKKFLVSGEEKEKLKALNKKLKSASTITEKMAAFLE